MHEKSGDWQQTRASRRRIVRRLALALALSLAALPASSMSAQMLGAPVLQNAWATPGLIAALDFASGSDGAVYAAAAAWAPASGHFQLSGGFGSRHLTSSGSRGVYGVRAAIPFGGGAQSNVGFAVFAGVGGVAGKTTTSTDSVTSTGEVPLGVAVGWRRALGASHGLSLYASPSYVLYSGGTKNGGLVRASLAADVGLTRSLGITAGVELGQIRSHAIGGPSGVLFGVGIAYAFGRR